MILTRNCRLKVFYATTPGRNGSQDDAREIAAYLLDPLAIDPSDACRACCSPKEADDLAVPVSAYRRRRSHTLPGPPPVRRSLSRSRRSRRAAEQTRFARLPAAKQVRTRQATAGVRRCINCHDVGDAVGKPAVAPAAVTFDAAQKAEDGCVAANAARREASRVVCFTEAQRQALKAFSQRGPAHVRSPLHERTSAAIQLPRLPQPRRRGRLEVQHWLGLRSTRRPRMLRRSSRRR
jgi:hypothetical protein